MTAAATLMPTHLPATTPGRPARRAHRRARGNLAHHGPTPASSSGSGLPTITSAFRRCRRRHCYVTASQRWMNRCESSSLLTELQGSLILVNFSVLPSSPKVYLPGV
jgi:hypothetical protein